MAGKGSKPRKVNLELYSKNYDSIFPSKEKTIDNFSPKDVDLSDGLRSTFGLYEFEQYIIEIIKFLSDDSKKLEFGPLEDYGDELGWYKKFKMNTFDISPVWFSMLCAAGWISNAWFPKGSFTVSKALIERIYEKQIKCKNENKTIPCSRSI